MTFIVTFTHWSPVLLALGLLALLSGAAAANAVQIQKCMIALPTPDQASEWSNCMTNLRSLGNDTSSGFCGREPFIVCDVLDTATDRQYQGSTIAVGG